MVIAVIASVSGMSCSAISSISLPMLCIWRIPVPATSASRPMIRTMTPISFWPIERLNLRQSRRRLGPADHPFKEIS